MSPAGYRRAEERRSRRSFTAISIRMAVCTIIASIHARILSHDSACGRCGVPREGKGIRRSRSLAADIKPKVQKACTPVVRRPHGQSCRASTSLSSRRPSWSMLSGSKGAIGRHQAPSVAAERGARRPRQGMLRVPRGPKINLDVMRSVCCYSATVATLVCRRLFSQRAGPVAIGFLTWLACGGACI